MYNNGIGASVLRSGVEGEGGINIVCTRSTSMPIVESRMCDHNTASVTEGRL